MPSCGNSQEKVPDVYAYYEHIDVQDAFRKLHKHTTSMCLM